ncbi:MAG: Smr/MutS family protein [Neisseria sp.]|nr:Smr/MutS family protein [Neisseria sp.]
MSSVNWQNQLNNLSKSARAEQAAAAEQEKARAAQKQRAAEVDFAAAVGAVTPLKSTNRRPQENDNRPIHPRRQEAERDDSQDVFIGSGSLNDEPPAQYAHGGGGKNDVRKLLAAKHEIVATLDLHGYQQEEAQVVLNEFIDYVQQRGVIGEIIHGSGLGSRGFMPALKHLVRRWLMAHPTVLAYTEPPGNDGAVWILLKRKRRETSY